MAASALEVLLLLKARDEASNELNKVHGALSNLGNTAIGVGKVLAVGLAAGAAGVAAGLGAAANAAAGFEQTMSGVKAVSGATADQMSQLSQKALELGKATVFSASEAGQGIEELVKGGISIEDIMGGAAEATLSLASAGGVDLTTAANIATAAMSGFNKSGAEMGHVVDLVAGAANASRIDVNQFGLALSQVSAVASTVGLSFDDTAVAIAELGNAGLVGSDAGTSLKTMLLNLSPATKQATTEMKALGIITADGANQFFDAEGHAKGFAEISGVLRDATKGLTDEQKINALQTMFGTDAIRAAAIMAKQGAEGFEKLADDMGKVTAQAVAAERLNNLKGDLEQLKGSVETAAITLGLALLPALRGAAQGATEFVNGLIPLIESQGPALVAMLQNAGTGLVTFGAHLRDSASTALQSVADKLAETGAAWAPWAAQAGPAGAAVSASLTGVSGIVQSLQLLLQGNFAGAWATAGTSMEGFSKAVDAVRAAFDQLLPQVDRDEIWKNLGDEVAILGETFGILGEAFGQVGDYMDDGGKSGSTFANALVALSVVVKGIVIVIREMAVIIRDTITVLIAIATALDNVGEAMERLQQAITAGVVQGFRVLAASAREAGNTLQELGVLAGIAFDALGSSARAGLDQLGTSIGTFFDQLGANVQAGLASIRQFFLDTWNAIPEDIRADLELVTKLIVAGIATWLASVTDTMTQIGASISGGWAAISAVVGDAMSALGTAVQSAWQAITGSTTTAMAENTSLISTGWNDVLSVTQAAWTAITDAIGGALATAVAAVSAWVGRVIAAVQGLAGEMGKAGAAAGQAVVDGLTGALTSGIRLVGDKAAEMAQATLEAAKNALGATSPSKRFAEIGQNIIEGLIQGIEENSPSVAAAMSDSLKSAMSGLQRGSGSGGFLTIPQFGSAIKALGFSADAISAICGPIAAQGIAEGLGKSISLIDVEAISTKIGAYARGAGTFGSGAFQKILSAIGIDSRTGSFQEAVDAAMKGIPVAISTPLHYFLSQGFDQATQQFVVGNTGTALKAGAAKMTAAAIEGVAGAATYIIPKVEAAGVALRGLAGDIAASFTSVAPDAVSKFSTLLSDLSANVDTESANIADKMASIATSVASGIAKAVENGGKQIDDAVRSAQDQTDRLGGAYADPSSTISQQRGLEGEIAAAKALHAQQRADADALFAHQQDLAKASLQFDKDVAKAKTDLDRANIKESYTNLINSLDTSYAQRVADTARTRALDAADRAFGATEDAKLVAFKEAALLAERDAKILASQQATEGQIAAAQEGADKERALLAKSYLAKLHDLQSGLLAKLPGLTGEAAVTVQSLLDAVATEAATVTDSITGSMGTVAGAAQMLATKFGVSFEQASAIVSDHGKVVARVLGGNVPGSIEVADKAVEDFADAFGLTWEAARTILETTGATADAVMGKQIPAAARLTVGALNDTGKAQRNLLEPIRVVKDALGDLAEAGFQVAQDAAATLKEQFPGFFSALEDQFPGLTSAINDLISKLGEIPTEITTVVTTEFAQSDIHEGSNRGASSSGSGSSGQTGHDSSAPDLSQAALSSQSNRADLRNNNYAVGQNPDGTYYAEKRARGGSARGGVPYFVGEHGPELFTPQQSGSISPNGMGGGLDYGRLAAAIVNAMQSAPAPRVDVEEIRSSLVRIGARNSGYVGLA